MQNIAIQPQFHFDNATAELQATIQSASTTQLNQTEDTTTDTATAPLCPQSAASHEPNNNIERDKMLDYDISNIDPQLASDHSTPSYSGSYAHFHSSHSGSQVYITSNVQPQIKRQRYDSPSNF